MRLPLIPKTIIYAHLLLLWALMLMSCSSQRAKTQEIAREPFRVGLEGDYAPYNWTTLDSSDEAMVYPFSGQKGYAAGYDVLMAKALAMALDRPLEIRKISWDGLILALESHQIDAIIAGMSPTPERLQAIGFSDAYYQDTPELVIMVQKDGPYAQASLKNDFSGARISAQQGTYHANLLSQLPSTPTTMLSDAVALMQSLNAGVIDGYLTELAVGQEHMRANSNFAMVQLIGDEALQIAADSGVLAIGVRKEDEQLRLALNAALAQISLEQRSQMMQRAKALSSGISDDKALEVVPSPEGAIERVVYLLVNYWPFFWHGTQVTLLLALFGTIFGLWLAFGLVAMQSHQLHFKDKLHKRIFWQTLKGLARLYIDVIRGTPMVVQAALFYYGFFSRYSQNILLAGLIVIAFNTAAYLAEILRSGMQGLGHQQLEAARSLGLSRRQAMRTVVMPQVLRMSLPSINNEFITNIKDSAVLSIIGMGELFYNARAASSQSYFTFESYLIVAAIYLLLTVSLTRMIEAWVAKLDSQKAKEL